LGPVGRLAGLLDPLAGAAPAAFHLGDAEEPVAVFADLLGAVPLEQVVGRAADAGGGSEGVQALFATLLAVVEGPAEPDESKDDEEEDLDDVGGVGEEGVGGLADVGAELER